MSNSTVSEQYRLAAHAANKLLKVAETLEKGESIFIEKEKDKLIAEAVKNGERLSDTAAERKVKITKAYQEYVAAMLAAKQAARDAREELVALKMRHMELNNESADRRAEMKL